MFEIEAVGGFGWFRNTNPYWKSGDKKDRDHVSAKAGLNLNFNVGKKKAWTVALKPAVIWDMTVVGREHLNMNADSVLRLNLLPEWFIASRTAPENIITLLSATVAKLML